jgi:S-adenosylmethionine hydrolase
MSIITLITDFGDKDGYAGVMKGVILRISPDAVIVDISHQIDPQDLVQAAFLIHSSYRYFPVKTVHMVIVDPGVGTGRAVLAFEAAGHFFIGPDNGVLHLISRSIDISWLVTVDNPDLFLHPISDTFHGRDIFAPVAAHLLTGVSPETLGSFMDPEEMVALDYKDPQKNENHDLVGTIIDVDRFGNLITDLDASWFVSPGHLDPDQQFRKKVIVTVGDKQVKGLAATFMDRRAGNLVAYIGSRNVLEIAINQGDAAARLHITKGAHVKVTFPINQN